MIQNTHRYKIRNAIIFCGLAPALWLISSMPAQAEDVYMTFYSASSQSNVTIPVYYYDTSTGILVAPTLYTYQLKATSGGISTTGAGTFGTLSSSGSGTFGSVSSAGAGSFGSVSSSGVGTFGSLATSGSGTFGSLTTSGATNLNGTTNINGIANLYNQLHVDSNGSAAGGSTLSVTNSGTTISSDSDNNPNNGSGSVNVQENQVSVTVVNPTTGHVHGLTVGTDNVRISGGTTSSTVDVNDAGMTFNSTNSAATVNVTNHRITNVAPGVNPGDAVNMQQLQAVAAGVGSVNNRIDELSKQTNQGIASTVALSMLPEVREGQKFMIGVGTGHYHSSDAIAFGMSAHLPYNGMLKVGVSDAGGHLTSGAGVGFGW